jgi:hypothetical protein
MPCRSPDTTLPQVRAASHCQHRLIAGWRPLEGERELASERAEGRIAPAHRIVHASASPLRASFTSTPACYAARARAAGGGGRVDPLQQHAQPAGGMPPQRHGLTS